MIQKTNVQSTRSGKYDGFTTNLLIGECNTGCNEISLQITNVIPGKMQTIHSHPQCQCYYVINGKGRVIIDKDEEDLLPGDSVLIPAYAMHGIKNIGEEILQYLTANKSFGVEREREIWFAESKATSVEERKFH
jgi:oxalate decarboxylase/phosphoglucose isomerase-like protein (cupin superfamily)